MADKQTAKLVVEDLWQQFVKARALCPYINEDAVGASGYMSADWYVAQGAVYFVNLASPLTEKDVLELRKVAGFINRSFVISLFGALESFDIVPYQTSVIEGRPGWEHVKLLKRLRHCFAHGWSESSPRDELFKKARPLLEKLFPTDAAKDNGLPTTINTILETLKSEALHYIEATP